MRPLLLPLGFASVTAAPDPAKLAATQGLLRDFSWPGWFPTWDPFSPRVHTARLDPWRTFGVWEGWGTSLAWWANVLGQREDIADLLFTLNDTVRLSDVPESLPGLGLNIARYNAGASSQVPAFGQTMRRSPKMPDFKAMQTFWLDWGSSDPASSSWNWTVDANQVNMLRLAVKRLVDLPTLFSVSPVWWQCLNQDPSGSPLGTTDNLNRSEYDNHAVYLATVAKQFAQVHGVHFDSVEPFNEPSSNWWVANGTQEGCHFDIPTQAEIILRLKQELVKAGLENVTIAASDENTYDEAIATWRYFRRRRSIASAVGRINVHGYQYGTGNRRLLRSVTRSKKLWNTEYGEGDATGLNLVTNLNADFQRLRNTAWVYWQALDGGGWGLLQTDELARKVQSVNTKYYALAHYTRHIRPGMRIIGSGDTDTVAAVDEQGGKVVWVTMNYGQARNITFNLRSFWDLEGLPVANWITQIKNGGNSKPYAQGIAGTVRNGELTVHFDTFTLQTFEARRSASAEVVIST